MEEKKEDNVGREVKKNLQKKLPPMRRKIIIMEETEEENVGSEEKRNKEKK